MIKIYQEVIAIYNLYTPNNIATKCIKQKITDLWKEIINWTIIVGDLNHTLNIL